MHVTFHAALMLMLALDPPLPDPERVASNERIAVVNRLFESADGAEIDRYYRDALRSYVWPFQLAAEVPTGPDSQPMDRSASDWIQANEYALQMRFDWPAESVAHVDRWLAANAECLSALEKVTGGERWYQPLAAETGRLFNVDLFSLAAQMSRLARLRTVAAARLAHAGKHADAMREAIATLRMAAHADQRPFAFWRKLGGACEHAALKQLAGLLPFLKPAELLELEGAYDSHLASPRANTRAIAFAESLYLVDYIECLHEWARDEARHASMREDLAQVLSMHATMPELRELGLWVKKPWLDTVDQLKAELLKTTPEKSWSVALRQERCFEEWAALPLNLSIARFDPWVAQLQEIVRECPALRLNYEVDLLPPGESRLHSGYRAASRAGFSTLLALHRFKADYNHWPASLGELVPGYLSRLPEDPFSGEPLKYRRSPDGNFVLYSVAENLQDDGGTPVGTKAAPNAVEYPRRAGLTRPLPRGRRGLLAARSSRFQGTGIRRSRLAPELRALAAPIIRVSMSQNNNAPTISAGASRFTQLS